MTTIKISIEYLQREKREKSRDVLDWIKTYCSRNKINTEIVRVATGIYETTSEPYLEIVFKSRHQKNIFVRKGNDEFPYFEFI
jgi:hypothetical protein